MKLSVNFKGNSGAPGETRTPDPLLRRQLLYPTELLARETSAADSIQTFSANPA